MPPQWWSTQFSAAERVYKQAHISKRRPHSSRGRTEKDPWVLGTVSLLFSVWRKPAAFGWNQRSHRAHGGLDLRHTPLQLKEFQPEDHIAHSNFLRTSQPKPGLMHSCVHSMDPLEWPVRAGNQQGSIIPLACPCERASFLLRAYTQCQTQKFHYIYQTISFANKNLPVNCDPSRQKLPALACSLTFIMEPGSARQCPQHVVHTALLRGTVYYWKMLWCCFQSPQDSR